MLWTLMSGSAREVYDSIFNSSGSIKFLFYFLFQAAGVYFNLYFLIPKFLEKGQYIQYFGLLAITVICTAVIIVPGYYLSAWYAGKAVDKAFYIGSGNQYFYLFRANSFPATIACMTLAMSVKFAKNWIQTRRREQLLEKEKLETELKFLKSQFNPHFLFNTINSIFVLIRKDPTVASDSLAKFSDLLRYQLYECNEHQIPLAKELSYLENFIELEKLRQDHNIKLLMKIDQPHSGNLTIAPFILIPFIENAFKHVSRQKDTSNWINMSLHIDKHQLFFDISNSRSSHHQSFAGAIDHSGIGLKNVRRRLDLVYPENHELIIREENEQFHVQLRLNLSEHKTVVPETVHTELSIA
jgi:LytS/YehU family sensor histidine kinase